MYFKTIQEFKQYLSTKKKPKWLTKLIIHHTYTPTVGQWKGQKTFNAILRHYKSLGWSSYPHIFVAPDGIWVMNDVTKKGTASNNANSFSLAIEIVGRYDAVVWQDPIKTLALQTLLALLDWSSLEIHDILSHRIYNPAKTCPGKAIKLSDVYELLHAAKNKRIYKVIVDKARIRQGPSLDYTYSDKHLYMGDVFESLALEVDEKDPKYSWAHVTKGSSKDGTLDHLGFVRNDLLQDITS